MENLVKIALVGDYSEDVIAHQAIPKAVQIAADKGSYQVSCEWVDTTSLDYNVEETLAPYKGVWCVPASPYKSMSGAIAAIRYVRENNIPFLGTCGGYQHAALEYAQNVNGHNQADNGEVNPSAKIALIAALKCAIREEDGAIKLKPGSKIATIYNTDRIVETYNCGYGINPQHLNLLVSDEMQIGSVDEDNDPRSLELSTHRFFIATAFQPERSALSGDSHPLIQKFVDEVCAN